MIGVTGSGGVLGSIICKQLDEKSIPYSCYEDDIREVHKLDNWLNSHKIDTVIFLAALVAIKDVNEDRPLAYDVNVGGIISLIKSVSKINRPIYIFFASSSHVYKSNEQPIKETDEIEPINTYGTTKYIAEIILNDFIRQSPFASLCIGRIFSFYHISQKPPYLYPTLLKRFETEDLSKPFKVYGALSTRDFLNAEIVCEYILKLIELKATGTFNIASGKGVRILDFIKEISPRDLNIIFDQSEVKTHLVANVDKLRNILNE